MIRWISALFLVAIFAVPAGANEPGQKKESDAKAEKPAIVTLTREHPEHKDQTITVSVDYSAAPDLEKWAKDAGEYALKWYPMIEKELASPGYTPTREFKIVFKEMKGVAHAAGNVITVAAAWPRQRPEDMGMIGHELVHVIQRYRSRSNPGWLVEGVADYVRYYVIEPGSKMGRFDPERSDYRRGYQPAGGLLNWIEKKTPGTVAKLNQIMREGQFKPDTFKTLAGGEPDELWEKFKADAKKESAAAK